MTKIKEQEVWQVLRANIATGQPKLLCWFTSQSQAEDHITDNQELYQFVDVWVEEGEDYISKRCECCGTIHCTYRSDFYGFRAGWWCDECFNNATVCTVQRKAYSD